MAAVTRVNPSLATPTGEARIRRGLATVAIAAGQVVAVDGTVTPGAFHETAFKLGTGAADGLGIALTNVAVNGVVNVLIDGEVGGFSGLPKGQYLSVTTGELDTTAPTGSSRFYAYSDSVVMVL